MNTNIPSKSNPIDPQLFVVNYFLIQELHFWHGLSWSYKKWILEKIRRKCIFIRNNISKKVKQEDIDSSSEEDSDSEDEAEN